MMTPSSMNNNGGLIKGSGKSLNRPVYVQYNKNSGTYAGTHTHTHSAVKDMNVKSLYSISRIKQC